MRRLRKLRRFLALPIREQLLTLEAAGWLAVSDTAVLLLPFRWIAAHLAKNNTPPDREPGDGLAEVLLRSLHLAIRNVPWAGTCLVQAIAGKLFMARHGISCILILGIARRNGTKAHAWIRVRNAHADGSVESEYQELARFAS